MRGLHLTADLYRCRCHPAWLTDAGQLADRSRQAAEAAGLHIVEAVARPHGHGASAALLLPHSHVCVHTAAAERSVTADVYLAHPSDDLAAQARILMDALLQQFQPEWTEQRSMDRGEPA